MTIFALSSAPGQSGIAVFRISGPETGDIIKMITNSDEKVVLQNNDCRSLNFAIYFS